MKVEYRCDASTGNADLYLYGVVGGGKFEEGFTPQDVRQALAATKDATALNVYIDSPGGDAYGGIAIYNQLIASGKRINTEVHGLAGSAASVIFVAGDSRVMHPMTEVMVHAVRAGLYGTSKDLRKAADTADVMTADIVKIYAKRTGLAEDEIAEMVEAETWLQASDALAKGFATKIVEPKARMAAWCVKNPEHLLAFFEQSRPKRVPDRVLNRIVPGAKTVKGQASDETAALRERIDKMRADFVDEDRAATDAIRERIKRMRSESKMFTNTERLREEIAAMQKPNSDQVRQWVAEAKAGLRPNVPPRREFVPSGEPHKPGDILRQVHARSIREAAYHESAHALVALWRGTKLRHVSVDFVGNGLTQYASRGTPANRLLQVLAGLACNDLRGDQAPGISGEGGDLQMLCTIVEEMTGQGENEETVLHSQAVCDARETLDDFLTANASAIGELADLLVLHAGEEIDGATVTRIWERHVDRRRMAGASI